MAGRNSLEQKIIDTVRASTNTQPDEVVVAVGQEETAVRGAIRTLVDRGELELGWDWQLHAKARCAASAPPEPDGGEDEPPRDFLHNRWPWCVYTTAYGLRVRHEITGTELDLYDAAKKLNDYDSAWRAARPSPGAQTPTGGEE